MQEEAPPFALTLLLDKPLHWTSFDVVNKLRYAARAALGRKKIKVGHAGTLDPLASGLLIVCFGRDTRRINELTGLNKTYTGTLQLGATTPSYDLETGIDQRFETDHLTREALYEAAASLTGPIEQQPPAYSAKRIDGKKAYELARKGKTPEMKHHQVHIHRFDITTIEGARVHFEVECSKGTYIRSLAHDFGVRLQNGAHLIALRRTAIGHFRIEDAHSIDEAIMLLQQAAKIH